MFKATDIETGEPVIILDVAGGEELARLREQSRSGRIRCPVCNQVVVVRAGIIKRNHFAHKQLKDCPSAHESAEILDARSTLYRWLKTKFGDTVTVEEWLDGITTPHAVDCWVEAKGQRFAYWIIDRNRRPDYRGEVQYAASQSNAQWHFVCVSSMMHRLQSEAGVLNLSVTEREFLRRYKYDAVSVSDVIGRNGGSLHYINATDKTFTTFRSMHCTELPQQFTGREITTPLDALMVTSKTGAFVHPGEHEQLTQWLRKERQRKQAERERESFIRTAHFRRRPSVLRTSETIVYRSVSPEQETHPPPTEPLYQEPEGICRHCGRRTRDWWAYDGKTGLCQCRACQKKKQNRE